MLPRKEWTSARTFYARFASNIDRDGRFRIEDVPPGHYELEVNVNATPDPAFCGAGTKIGQAKMDVTMPEIPGGRSSEPLDLGTITAKLFETVKAGDLAPDFTVRRIGGQGDGDRLKLSDFQGKLVLMDFWATWCGPCLAEMPALKDIQETFGGNPRFRLIGLSCDQSAETAEEYLRAQPDGLDRRHSPATSLASVGTSYKLRAIPATFLVGPDGRILAKNLRGAALKGAVARALKDESLFKATTWAPRPARFPVTRFDAAAEGPARDRPTSRWRSCSTIAIRTSRRIAPITMPCGFSGRRGASGQVTTSSFPDFNTCQSVGGTHGVAIDRERGRIYFSELVARRVIALDFRGRKLWQVDQIDAEALAVDPRTGNLWCTVGTNYASGETVVLDATGREVDELPRAGAWTSPTTRTPTASGSPAKRTGSPSSAARARCFSTSLARDLPVSRSRWTRATAAPGSSSVRIPTRREAPTGSGTSTQRSCDQVLAARGEEPLRRRLRPEDRNRLGFGLSQARSSASRPTAASCRPCRSRRCASRSARRPAGPGRRPRRRSSGSTQTAGQRSALPSGRSRASRGWRLTENRATRKGAANPSRGRASRRAGIEARPGRSLALPRTYGELICGPLRR